MGVLDVFNTDAFGVISLSDAINKQPLMPQKIALQGLFENGGVSSTSVMIEELNGTLNLIPTAPRGGAPWQAVRDGRSARSLVIPHLPTADTIMADEVSGVRMFGSETEVEIVDTVVNARLAKLSMELDMTIEWHRIGALKGEVLDADSSSIYNLFTEFGVTQETEIDFDLDNGSPAAGAVRQLCHDVIRLIRANMGGAGWSGVACMCGETFFDQLVSHPEVATAYERAVAFQAAQAAGVSGPGGFARAGLVDMLVNFAGITFWEYSNTMGSETAVAVDPLKAHFYPVGAPGLFVTRYGPANYIETVNTVGIPKYSKAAVDADFQKWVKVEAQTNSLNLCTRPKVLIPGRNT